MYTIYHIILSNFFTFHSTKSTLYSVTLVTSILVLKVQDLKAIHWSVCIMQWSHHDLPNIIISRTFFLQAWILTKYRYSITHGFAISNRLSHLVLKFIFWRVKMGCLSFTVTSIIKLTIMHYAVLFTYDKLYYNL